MGRPPLLHAVLRVALLPQEPHATRASAPAYLLGPRSAVMKGIPSDYAESAPGCIEGSRPPRPTPSHHTCLAWTSWFSPDPKKAAGFQTGGKPFFPLLLLSPIGDCLAVMPCCRSMNISCVGVRDLLPKISPHKICISPLTANPTPRQRDPPSLLRPLFTQKRERKYYFPPPQKVIRLAKLHAFKYATVMISIFGGGGLTLQLIVTQPAPWTQYFFLSHKNVWSSAAFFSVLRQISSDFFSFYPLSPLGCACVCVHMCMQRRKGQTRPLQPPKGGGTLWSGFRWLTTHATSLAFSCL